MANYQTKLVLRPKLVLRRSSRPKSKVTHCRFRPPTAIWHSYLFSIWNLSAFTVVVHALFARKITNKFQAIVCQSW